MDRCQGMSFDQLSRFIENALEKLSDSTAPDDRQTPRSQKELLALCDMLGAKAVAITKNAPVLEPPKYDGPDNPGPFIPSHELRSLYNKRERYEKHAEDAYEGSSKTVQEWTEDQLQKMEEQELAPVEERERRRHDKLVAAYREARKPYSELYQRWAAEVNRKQEAQANREAVVRRMYRKAKRNLSSERMDSLPFEIAAPGEGTDEHIRGYYREVLRQRRIEGFSQERFDKMLALPRSNWKKGTAGKYGYIVLMFAHTKKVLLECPVYANAIFVLDSGEERLLKMNKQELNASNEVKKIVHTGDWYRRLKEELGIDSNTDSLGADK